VQKLFKGKVESFDPATREIVLSYGFDTQEELEDWGGGPDNAIIKDGKILSSSGSSGFTRTLKAAFEGDLTMETVSVPRLGHAGKWWISYKPAGDEGKGGRAGTTFRSIYGPSPGYTKGAEQRFDFKFDSRKFYRHEMKFEGSTIHYSVDGKPVTSFAPLNFPAEREDQHPGYNVGGYGFGGIDSFRVRGTLSKKWLEENMGEGGETGDEEGAGAEGAGSDATGYGATWTKKDPKGDTPGAGNRFGRSGGAPGAMYDSRRKLCIMYGGTLHGQSRMNDIWAYDVAKNAWTCLEPLDKDADDKKKPGGWGGSTGAPMVYDPANDLYWLASGGINDKSDWWWLWTYDPNKKTYSKIMKIQGADLRFEEGGLGDCVLGYSPKLKSIVTPWEVIDTRTRQKRPMKPLTKMPLRGSFFSHASPNGLGTAGADGTFLVFGGQFDKDALKSPGETWKLDPARGTWMKLQPKKSPPAGRRRSMVYHRKLNVWVMASGGMPGSRACGMWVYSPRMNTWLEMKESGPRGWGAMWYDEANDDVVFFSEEHGAIHTLKLSPR
jgi:hypothetical protein